MGGGGSINESAAKDVDSGLQFVFNCIETGSSTLSKGEAKNEKTVG
jgi:hypothetical protein